MANLPKVLSPSEEIIHKIAMDVGKQVVFHIEHVYPKMFEAVAAKSAARSIRNCTHNAIMEAVKAADEGRIEAMLKRHEDQRRHLRKTMRFWRRQP